MPNKKKGKGLKKWASLLKPKKKGKKKKSAQETLRGLIDFRKTTPMYKKRKRDEASLKYK